jgi:hypothetical protein
VRGESFIDNGLSTRFVTHVPQKRDDETGYFREEKKRRAEKLRTYVPGGTVN